MTTESNRTDSTATPVRSEPFPAWPLVVASVVLWTAVFCFWGNSTFGYLSTPSAFAWWHFAISGTPEEGHIVVLPLFIAALYWLKREELVAVPKRIWWPALLLVMVAAVLHVLGFFVQQTRLSLIGWVLGAYGLTGLFWGGTWLRATIFPTCLFAFCFPLGSMAEFVTHPLRLLATKLAAGFSHQVLGLDVIREGTRIFDVHHKYDYDVAPACSGIRSLSMMFALTTIYAFTSFNVAWKRILIVVSSIPLAIAANVARLLLIIVAAEGFGRQAGDYVHESSWLSLLPYVPAFAGIGVIGYLLERPRPPTSAETSPNV